MPKYVQLRGEFAPGELKCMKLRSPIVVRLHKFKQHSEPHEYLFSQLELYYIFKSSDEKQKCMDSLQFCTRIFNQNIEDMNYVRAKCMPFLQSVEEATERARDIIDEDTAIELDPTKEQDEGECMLEGIEETDGFVAFDPELSPKDGLKATEGHFKRIVVSNTLNEMTRKLDPDQMFVVDEAIDYAKQYIKAINGGYQIPKAKQLVVVGGAGTGKSHVINIVSQWTESIFRSSGDNLDHPFVIKCAPSGCAASNIGGVTLHKAFHLPFGSINSLRPLADKVRDELRTVLKNLKIVIIDEFSMLKADILFQINERLKEIKQEPNIPFGGTCVLLFGDPLQLRPVKGVYPWEAPKNNKFQLSNLADPGWLWKLFNGVVLRTNHRQGEDGIFADCLNRLRTNQLSQEDYKLLRTRIVCTNSDKIPKDAIYVYARNVDVNRINEFWIDNLEGNLFTEAALVSHPTRKNFDAPVELNGNIINTNLQKILKIKVGARIMMTYNLKTTDGLTNGAFGEIVGFEFGNDSKIRAMHIHFYRNAGSETAKGYQYLKDKYKKDVIPIQRYEAQAHLGDETSSTITVYQFPIKLATAVTAHKVQGQTIAPPTSVVVDLKHAKFEAQVYVMLSRAQNLNQIFILDSLYYDNWKASKSGMTALKAIEENSENITNSLNQQFKIVCLNIHSLRNHFDDIKSRTGFLNANIICLQETWLFENDSNSSYQINDFNLELNSIGLGKGVATYFKSDFRIAQSIKLLNLQITKVMSNDLDVINVYRSRDNKDILNVLKNLIDISKKTIICGDFNLNFQKENHPLFPELRNLGFEQIITRPTHEQGNLIDLAFSNFTSDCEISVKQTAVRFSDHDIIQISFDV